MTRTITSKYFIELLDMKHEKSFRLKKDEMHPDDPMYAYVMKKKRVSTKQVSTFNSTQNRRKRALLQNEQIRLYLGCILIQLNFISRELMNKKNFLKI